MFIPISGSVTSAFGDFILTEFVADGESNPVTPLLASAEPATLGIFPSGKSSLSPKEKGKDKSCLM